MGDPVSFREDWGRMLSAVYSTEQFFSLDIFDHGVGQRAATEFFKQQNSSNHVSTTEDRSALAATVMKQKPDLKGVLEMI